MQLETQTKPNKSDIESAITDTMSDVHVLAIVIAEANESQRSDAGERSVIMVDEATFLAWVRACNRLTDSVRETERVFYGAEL